MKRLKPYYWGIALAIALYLFFSLMFLNLPGLQYDETNFVNAAMGNQDAPFITWSVRIFGKSVPLMIMNYIGAVKSAIYAPVFKIFGTSATSVRLPVVCIGLITLLLGAALLRRMFDRTIAIAALFLFAADPAFIFSNKLDWGPVSLMLALEMASLYFMWRWIKEEKRLFLGLAGFLFGLGLYNKIIFAWFIAAFFIGLFLCFREHARKLLRLRHLVCFLPAFLLGCLPLIAFNISVPMGTFRNQPVMDSIKPATLVYRYHLFCGTLDGSGIYSFFSGDNVAVPGGIRTNRPAGKIARAIGTLARSSWIRESLLPAALMIALGLILVLWRFKRLSQKKEILFLAIQLIFIALCICVTASATGAHHVLALYPFVFMIVAFAAVMLGRWICKSEAAAGIVTGVCLLPLVFSQVVIDARYLNNFQEKGGTGYWSDAIYELAAFARENPDRKFLFMDWGFSNQLVLLTGGHIQYEEFACDPKSLDACMDSVFAQRDIYLVFHVPPFDDPSMTDAYQKTLSRHHLQNRVAKTFYQKDGRPVYQACETTRQDLPVKNSGGSFCYSREAEDYDAKSGGSLDNKNGASNRKALGNYWGLHQEDFVVYKFDLPRSITDTHFYLRYAFEDANPQLYYLFLDGNYFSSITLPPTNGYGYTADQWKIFQTPLGNLAAGTHELKIKPAGDGRVVNLDYWSLCEGSSPPDR
jgi:4-amino-4-deoxy-L-arabinose transferase-like glycosyltransferase